MTGFYQRKGLPKQNGIHRRDAETQRISPAVYDRLLYRRKARIRTPPRMAQLGITLVTTYKGTEATNYSHREERKRRGDLRAFGHCSRDCYAFARNDVTREVPLRSSTYLEQVAG
ncbi:MAG: hypothetical protein HKP12_00005 [Gammaproteobacteria bacterium]|nr:hypothetical protein [Gammaproteobacteria bacterium]